MLQFALCYALLPAMERQLQLAVGSQLRGWSKLVGDGSVDGVFRLSKSLL